MRTSPTASENSRSPQPPYNIESRTKRSRRAIRCHLMQHRNRKPAASRWRTRATSCNIPARPDPPPDRTLTLVFSERSGNLMASRHGANATQCNRKSKFRPSVSARSGSRAAFDETNPNRPIGVHRRLSAANIIKLQHATLAPSSPAARTAVISIRSSQFPCW
jgi:hypothetical protein